MANSAASNVQSISENVTSVSNAVTAAENAEEGDGEEEVVDDDAVADQTAETYSTTATEAQSEIVDVLVPEIAQANTAVDDLKTSISSNADEAEGFELDAQTAEDNASSIQGQISGADLETLQTLLVAAQTELAAAQAAKDSA